MTACMNARSRLMEAASSRHNPITALRSASSARAPNALLAGVIRKCCCRSVRCSGTTARRPSTPRTVVLADCECAPSRRSSATYFSLLLTLAAIVPAQRTASPRSNILARARGTAVISVSSSYGGSWTAANLADGSTSTGWSSAQGAAFPHTVVFELPQPHAIVSIAVDNTGDQEGSYPGISSRRVAVYGSSTSITAGFTQLSAFEARRGGRMEVTLGAPVTARWLKFVVSSNWGNAEYTEVRELEAYGEPVGPPQRVDVTVPDAALRGLTALRDSGYQAAVA